MIGKIGSVPVFVKDQSRALEFYKERLGFEVSLDVPIGNGIRWLTVTPQKGSTELILFPPVMAGPDAELMQSRVGSWTGIVIFSDDCREDYSELAKRGVQFKSVPTQTFWGGWMAEFLDADNNSFQLVERPAYML
jgi:lactoylglutathione lyase